jgi:alpha-D-ribose 1-methylphosphonate 5-triphosphate diphosphatase
MNAITFINAQIVTLAETFHGHLHVVDGKIHSLDRGAIGPTAGPVYDLEGDYLLPGFVELHTDNLDKHAVPRANVVWPPRSAVLTHDAQMATSGVTTVYDAISLGDIKTGEEKLSVIQPLIEAIEHLSRDNKLRAQHFLHLRCELSYQDLMQVLNALAHGPLVRLISLMDHTPGQRQFASIDKYAEYYKGKLGFTDEALEIFMAERRAEQEKFAKPHRAGVIALARQLGVNLASHDDATAAHVDEAIEAGVVVAEFPTTMAAAKAATDAGLNVMGGAPNVVRGGSHSGNIAVLDLARAGHLSVLSSDYVPISLVDAIFRLAAAEAMTLPQAVACASYNPAAIMGLTDRGQLAEGLVADMVQVSHYEQMPIIRGVWRQGQRIG